MDTQSQILTAEVEFEGKTYRAPYFLEGDLIEANIEGRLVTTTSDGRPAEEIVRALMLEWLLQNTVRSTLSKPPEPSV